MEPEANTTEPTIYLSERERFVLDCLAMGLPNRKIGEKGGIAEATVKVHCKSIFRKLRVANRTQAALWAVTRPK